MFRFLYEAFKAFIDKKKKNLQRMSAATNYELSVEDLEQDAVLAVADLEQRRGRPINFDDPADQRLVMGTLHMRNVVRPEKQMRHSARLDEQKEDDEGNLNTWLQRLQATENSDPLVALLQREAYKDPKKTLADNYSQATAYAIFCGRLKNKREDICAYLAISNTTLAKRVTHAIDTVLVQSSLFDGIERIRKDFMPRRGKEYAVRAEQLGTATQLAWEF